MCNLISTLRMTIGPDLRLLTYRSINQNKSANSFSREEEANFSQMQTRRKFHDSAAEKEGSCSSYHSRCKSQSFEYIKDIDSRKGKR